MPVVLLGGKGMVKKWAYQEVKGHCGHAYEGDIDALVSLKKKKENKNLFLILKILNMPNYFFHDVTMNMLFLQTMGAMSCGVNL